MVSGITLKEASTDLEPSRWAVIGWLGPRLNATGHLLQAGDAGRLSPESIIQVFVGVQIGGANIELHVQVDCRITYNSYALWRIDDKGGYGCGWQNQWSSSDHGLNSRMVF